MKNYVIESSRFDPWWNLATETHLSDRVRPGDLLLYLWQNERTVVIGRGQNALRECRASLLEAEGGRLARRTTGGGAVYQDLGNLCFTFLASPERYDLQRQMKVIGAACRKFGIETVFSGRNDILTADGRKFSGNAFSVNETCRIQHGTLMIRIDEEKLGRYLTPSKEKLAAKGVRSVQSRVCNLQDLNPDLTVEGMKAALAEAFSEEYGEAVRLTAADLDRAAVEALYETYASWDWRYGKSPACETVCSRRFAWGEVEVHLQLTHLRVSACKVYSDALDEKLPEILEKILIGRRYDGQGTGEEKRPAFCTEEQQKAAEEVLGWLSEEAGRAQSGYDLRKVHPV